MSVLNRKATKIYTDRMCECGGCNKRAGYVLEFRGLRLHTENGRQMQFAADSIGGKHWLCYRHKSWSDRLFILTGGNQ
jgi:hypothetical protein